MTTHGSLANIEKLESDLWEAADNLRANSKLTMTGASSLAQERGPRSSS